MNKNFTITVTLQDDDSLRMQATCENISQGEISYFLDVVNDEIKRGVIMESLSEPASTYIEEFIDL